MAKANKQGRGKQPSAGEKNSVGATKAADVATETKPGGDPLRAFPPDPPQPNRRLLLISVALFVAWFCYLAYVALRG